MISVDLKRKDIRKGNWKSVYSIWDANWEIDNKEQVFGIYEEDNESSQTFNVSIKTTVKDAQGNQVEQTVGFSVTVKSKEPIIRQLGWNRESFFLNNRGGLINNCGTRNGWTVYDCNLDVQYTMPQQ